jgi:CheY-like chemotaxis protein
LIVDDEPDALQLFGRVLASSGRGYRVLLARDGAEALAILSECRPDVILLDLVMPNMDGFQLIEAKSQDPALRDIPVVVISARDPAGQPIVSNALGVTRAGGLSAHNVLTCIKALSEALSTAAQPAGPAPTADLPA